MANRKRYRHPQNRPQHSAPNRSSDASRRGKDRARDAWTVGLRRRLRALAAPFKSTRASRGAKAEGREAGLAARLLKAGATFVVLTTVVVVATALLSDLMSGGRVTIKPLLISPELQSKLNDQMVANHLKHNISVMIREAKSVRRSQGFEVPLSTVLPDVQVPAANISVKTLMRYVQEFPPLRYVKRLFGLNPAEVDGEILLDGDRVRINLRITEDAPGGPVVEPRTFTASPGNIEPAIDEASQSIMAYAEPYLWAAYLYQKKRPEEALAQIQHCLQKDPAGSRHMALTLWGLILIDQGKNAEAIAKLEEATKYVAGGHERELAAAYSNWGLALLYECRSEEAVGKFEEAIRHDPTYALSYNNYGSALLSRGETDRAIEKLEQALKHDPGLETAYYNLAYARADDKPDDAVAHYLAAIKHDPEYVEAYSGLGLVLVDGVSPTRPDEALEKLDRAIELDRNFAPAYGGRALAWAEKGDFKRAIADQETAVRLYPNLPEAKRRCGDFEAKYARAYNNLGWFYEEEGDYDSAAANYQKAIDLDPTYYLAYAGKGDALRKAGRLDEALPLYETVLRAPEASAGARFFAYKGKGEALLTRHRKRAAADRRGDLELSVSMFDEALKLRPAAKDVQDALAQARRALERLPRKAG